MCVHCDIFRAQPFFALFVDEPNQLITRERDKNICSVAAAECTASHVCWCAAGCRTIGNILSTLNYDDCWKGRIINTHGTICYRHSFFFVRHFISLFWITRVKMASINCSIIVSISLIKFQTSQLLFLPDNFSIVWLVRLFVRLFDILQLLTNVMSHKHYTVAFQNSCHKHLYVSNAKIVHSINRYDTMRYVSPEGAIAPSVCDIKSQIQIICIVFGLICICSTSKMGQKMQWPRSMAFIQNVSTDNLHAVCGICWLRFQQKYPPGPYKITLHCIGWHKECKRKKQNGYTQI